jgi:hypothetical protein
MEVTVRYQVNGEDRTTLPLWEILHECSVMHGRELLMLATVNAIEYVSHQTTSIGNSVSRLTPGKETKVLRQVIRAYLANKHRQEIKSFRTCIRLTDIKTKEIRYLTDEAN